MIFSSEMHLPSSAKLWQMPTPPTVLPTPLPRPERTVPLEEQETSYLADSASIFSFSSTPSFIKRPSLFPSFRKAKIRQMRRTEEKALHLFRKSAASFSRKPRHFSPEAPRLFPRSAAPFPQDSPNPLPPPPPPSATRRPEKRRRPCISRAVCVLLPGNRRNTFL